ncbi:PaaI family thioesterase [bacterium]|nr:PaaI family thioesterase [bacterium]
MIQHLPKLIERARHSPRWLLILNLLLSRVIPFNRPHGFRIAAITEEMVRSAATYRQVNRNHVRGIHACAIATVAEMSAGFLLLSRLDPQRYRLIMGRLEVDYHYQAKEGIVSESLLPKERLENEIIGPLREQEAVTVCMDSLVTDQSGNRIAEGRTTWQIKRWDRVRTKL